MMQDSNTEILNNKPTEKNLLDRLNQYKETNKPKAPSNNSKYKMTHETFSKLVDTMDSNASKIDMVCCKIKDLNDRINAIEKKYDAVILAKEPLDNSFRLIDRLVGNDIHWKSFALGILTWGYINS